MTRKVNKFFLWCYWDTKNISYSQTFEASDASKRLGHVRGRLKNLFPTEKFDIKYF